MYKQDTCNANEKEPQRKDTSSGRDLGRHLVESQILAESRRKLETELRRESIPGLGMGSVKWQEYQEKPE